MPVCVVVPVTTGPEQFAETVRPLQGFAEIRVLVCGDRNWQDEDIIDIVISGLAAEWDRGVEVIHGACRGADALAAESAELSRDSGKPVVVKPFPADWAKHGRKAGPIRNEQMLKEGRPNLVIAFHDDVLASKGTKDMLERAKRAGVPAIVISHYPAQIDGTMDP